MRKVSFKNSAIWNKHFWIFLSVSIILTSLRGSFDITKLWFGIRIEHLRCDKVNCSKRLILYKKLTVYSNWLLFGKSKYWSLNSYCLAIFGYYLMFSTSNDDLIFRKPWYGPFKFGFLEYGELCTTYGSVYTLVVRAVPTD